MLASPLAKTLAIELGIDLRTIEGTGPGGRIVERDVRAAAAGEAAAHGEEIAEAAPAQAAPAQAREAAPPQALAVVEQRPAAPAAALAQVAGEDFRDEPLSSMRKRIAQRMTEAKRDVPHFYLTRSFDAAPLLAFRQRLNALLGDRGKVSVNDLIIKAVALALRREPRCNAAFMGDALRYFNRVHIGVAVAIEQGLVTPVVRDADLKGIGRIAAEVRDLAQRARDRRLKMEEIQGSTFTVSNLGMFDIDEFQAIINPPEAALLSVGAAKDTPIVKDGQIAIGKRMTLSLSCDHRVIDGAMGARYLVALVELLEQPESLAL
jgi:pyruvate dehydrogenase E2 component (dihydrolipoamide acetyltransferase)